MTKDEVLEILRYDASTAAFSRAQEGQFGQSQNAENSAKAIATITALYAERDGLRAFADRIMGEWPDVGGLDGGDLQDIAERTGLLAKVTMQEPCGENCNCEGYGDFPMECYRKTSMLTGKPESDARITALRGTP